MGQKNPKYLELLNYLDVLVDGRFEIAKKDLNLLFRGSSNQRLINVPETIKQNKIVIIPESDGIIDSFKSKDKLYI